jgi:hypothetical protein
MENPATEYVHASCDLSPVHSYIADHGEAVDSSTIKQETIAGRSVVVTDALTEDERELVADAIRATGPQMKACFANALQMWAYDSRFKYAEGFAVVSDFGIGGIEHAWCLLDGSKLVDVTQPFDHYHGAVITDDETLQRYYEYGMERGSWGIVGNHLNQFQFLRNRGYAYG